MSVLIQLGLWNLLWGGELIGCVPSHSAFFCLPAPWGGETSEGKRAQSALWTGSWALWMLHTQCGLFSPEGPWWIWGRVPITRDLPSAVPPMTPPPACHLQFPLRVSDWEEIPSLRSLLPLGLWGHHGLRTAHDDSFLVPPWAKSTSACSSSYSHVALLSQEASWPLFKFLNQMLIPSPQIPGDSCQALQVVPLKLFFVLVIGSAIALVPLSNGLFSLSVKSQLGCVWSSPPNLQCWSTWHLFCYWHLDPLIKSTRLKFNILLSSSSKCGRRTGMQRLGHYYHVLHIISLRSNTL